MYIHAYVHTVCTYACIYICMYVYVCMYVCMYVCTGPPATIISPEMIVAGGPVLHRVLLNLFRQVWGEGCVFDEWKDALVVPVPKSGDLNVCDNW